VKLGELRVRGCVSMHMYGEGRLSVTHSPWPFPSTLTLKENSIVMLYAS
jgi:hypothetical protein